MNCKQDFALLDFNGIVLDFEAKPLFLIPQVRHFVLLIVLLIRNLSKPHAQIFQFLRGTFQFHFDAVDFIIHFLQTYQLLDLFQLKAQEALLLFYSDLLFIV